MPCKPGLSNSTGQGCADRPSSLSRPHRTQGHGACTGRYPTSGVRPTGNIPWARTTGGTACSCGDPRQPTRSAFALQLEEDEAGTGLSATARAPFSEPSVSPRSQTARRAKPMRGKQGARRAHQRQHRSPSAGVRQVWLDRAAVMVAMGARNRARGRRAPARPSSAPRALPSGGRACTLQRGAAPRPAQGRGRDAERVDVGRTRTTLPLPACALADG
eukprot:scaffold3827_cov394-Prasinococcus_capsulatus_cf.AAC.6